MGVCHSIIVIITVCAIAALFPFFYIKFSHKCSYVGELGIVEFTINGSLSDRPKTHLLNFKEAESLYTSQTRNYYNGIYTGTSYEYKWIKNSGSNYRLAGLFRNKEGWPNDKDRWHFANSAEVVWSTYLLQTANEQYDKLGYIEFPMKGNSQAVQVGHMFLEFVLRDGTTQKVVVEDMKDISLASGFFQFKHKDARWWSGKGKYSFTYRNIPNAKLFLLCLKRLTGIYWN